VLASRTVVSPFSTAEFSSGTDPEDALGALMGADIGASFGYGGLGIRGTGRGGGGRPGSIGLGRLMTRGDRYGRGTSRDGTCYGCRAAAIPNGERQGTGPSVRMGTPIVPGGLSADVIRRRIRLQRNAIRHCYERELVSRPDLSGRVAIRFVIGEDGAVRTASVASSTVQSPSVGQCVAGAVRRVSFPNPSQGVVVVTYPFSFIPASR